LRTPKTDCMLKNIQPLTRRPMTNTFGGAFQTINIILSLHMRDRTIYLMPGLLLIPSDVW